MRNDLGRGRRRWCEVEEGLVDVGEQAVVEVEEERDIAGRGGDRGSNRVDSETESEKDVGDDTD